MTKKSTQRTTAKKGVQALCVAVANSRLGEIDSLLAAGVDVNGVGLSSEETPLHKAAGLGLMRSLERLLAAGADVNSTKNKHELTPLMCACSFGKTKGSRAALRLIDAGADVTYERKSDEMTALKFAAHSCTAEVINRLIDRGAEVDGPRGTVQTALMCAARSGNLTALKVLIKRGADPFRKCGLKWADGRTAEGLAELERRRSAVKFLRTFRASEK